MRHLTNAFRDKLFNAPASITRRWAYQFIAQTQHDPENLVMGAAVVLLMLCKHYRIPVSDVLDYAGMLISSSLNYHGDPKGFLRATKAYIENELT